MSKGLPCTFDSYDTNSAVDALPFSAAPHDKLVALADEDRYVRRSVADVLGRAVDESAVRGALLTILRNRDEELDVRISAARALGNAVDEPEVWPALLAALGDDEPSVRAAAYSGLRRYYLSAAPQSLLSSVLSHQEGSSGWPDITSMGLLALGCSSLAIALRAHLALVPESVSFEFRDTHHPPLTDGTSGRRLVTDEETLLLAWHLYLRSHPAHSNR